MRSMDKIFLILTLSDPHAGQHIPGPNLDSAGTLESAGRTRPYNISLVECEYFL